MTMMPCGVSCSSGLKPTKGLAFRQISIYLVRQQAETSRAPQGPKKLSPLVSGMEKSQGSWIYRELLNIALGKNALEARRSEDRKSEGLEEVE